MCQRHRARVGASLDEADGPGMPTQDGALGERTLTQAGSPAAGRTCDLPEDCVDQRVEEGFLAGHVVIDRHPLDTQATAERSHRQAGEALLIGKRLRLIDDALRRERATWSGSSLNQP